MKPVLFSLGPVHIHSFGLLVALGVLLALSLMTKNVRYFGIERKNDIVDMVLTVVLCGFLGGRITYVLQEWQWYFENPLKIFAVWEGGLVFYGGLIGGMLGLLIFSRLKKSSFFANLDYLVVFGALAHAFGRIGCFLNGCCWGKVCDLPWAVTFPGHDHAVHPTQIYEAIFNMLLFLGLWKVYRTKHFRGQITLLYLIFYALGRFAIEYFRGDNPIILIFTLSQWIAVVFFLIAITAYFYLRKKSFEHAE